MYHKTPPLNSPWERSFYTAKPIVDVEEYWNNLNKRRQTMSDIEDKGYIDPTLPKLPTSRESDLLEEMIYDKEITLMLYLNGYHKQYVNLIRGRYNG